MPAAAGPPAVVAAPWALRRDLHGLHRLGSFLNCLSRKNSCSPAVKMNSPPQSAHVKSRSTNSIPLLPSLRKKMTARSTENTARRSALDLSLCYGARVVGRRHYWFAELQLIAELQTGACLTLGRWGSGRRVIEGPPPSSTRRPPTVTENNRTLVLFLPDLLAIALTCQRFLHTLLFTRLQIERMTFYFLDNVFRLNLALEAPQCVFKRLAFLNSNLCQG